MQVRIGTDCGILGTVVHMVEENERIYIYTSKDVEADITELI